MQSAIRVLYRDLEYAKSLVKARVATQEALASAAIDIDDGNEIEENWTFIGDESDPELQKRIQDWETPLRGRGPRVSLDRAGLRAMQGVEPVMRKGSVKK